MNKERAFALAAPMSIISIVFMLHGFPWTGLAWVSLVFAAILWTPNAMPMPQAVLRSKGVKP
jgi:hypothetical protein